MTAQDHIFGHYRFDRERKILFRRGVPVRLGRRCRDLLETLLAAEGRVVPKSMLLKTAWPSEHIEENNLAVQIAALRRILGKPAGGEQWIATVQRVGYQFVDPTWPKERAHDSLPVTPEIVDDDRPSVSVLPFASFDCDDEQQHLSGIVSEGVAAELSRFQNLVVLSNLEASSSGMDAGGTVAARRPSGGQYVIQGSVRPMGDRLRITAQLLDKTSGQHVWAERFEGDRRALLDDRDHVVQQIVGKLAGRLQASAVEKSRRKPAASLTARDYLNRANALPFDDPDSAREARHLLNKAIQLDPGHARAHALIADLTYVEWWNDMGSSKEGLEQAYEIAKKAVALDENDYTCQGVLGWALLLRREHDLAESCHLRAFELNPNRASVMACLGGFYGFNGMIERALTCMEKAKFLDPLFRPNWHCRMDGVIQFVARRPSEAIAAFGRAMPVPFWGHAYIAACSAMLSRRDDADRHKAEVLRLKPDFSLGRFAAREPYRRQADRSHLVEALGMAGLPD